MDYKDTLLMPKTEFEMRGKLPSKEPKIQARWQKEQLYEKMLAKRKDAKPFVLHDGPPYANGDIHLGHALNKIIKDIIVRSHFMDGYRTPYVPGWDTHGLPIETAITKQGHDRKKMPLSDFRKLCHEFALEQVERQKKGFLSVGCIGDYDHPYVTLQKEFEAYQIEVFGKMAMDGLIYKGLKPVYWSPSSESALAEAEIEYKDRKDPSIFVAFPVEQGNDVIKKGEHLVIWTTTPWTLPGNLGIAVGERFDYAKVEVNQKIYIIANELVETLAKEFGWDTYEIKEVILGTSFEGVKYRHVFMDRSSPVIIGFHVTLDAGTGLVHIAPGYGADDFLIGKQYDLGLINGVNDQGVLNEESGEFAGLFFEDANKAVTQRLDELGVLLKLKFITHSYPHDWRTKQPIIFRATTQWFASIDKIRKELLEQIDNVDWIPAWGQQRMHNMIADRGDWCISRQRAWGVPIPIFYGEDDTPIMDKGVFDHIAQLFREHGSNIWFEKEAKDLLPAGFTHPSSPNNQFRKEMDTMDVWFDSGSSHTGAMMERGLGYPADLYFEGSDQYRGWFNSSLIIGTAVHGASPYKQVLSHGFVMDGKGVKMSKSQWNAVAPAEITKKYGADILRLWAASVDYQADCSMSDEIMKQCSENYRKVRNTFRFMLANLNDFSKEDVLSVAELPKVDQYMILKLNQINDFVKKAYKEYRFADITSALTNLMVNEFSAYYLDFTKDILYIEKADDPRRRQVQSVLYQAVNMLLRLWAPILVHTCEEINDIFHAEDESIHLGDFKENIPLENVDQLEADMEELFRLRSEIFKALEEARAEKIIGKSLEAHVIMPKLEDAQKALIDEILPNFAQWLIVSKVTFTDESGKIKVEAATGCVCPRCWNITDSKAEDGVCDRCLHVLKG